MTDITIKKHEYEKMQRQLAKLNALEVGGVDNWEYYGEALSEWQKEGQIAEILDDAIDAINELMTEAEVDYPAGREAGSRITFDEEGMKAILSNLLAQMADIKK